MSSAYRPQSLFATQHMSSKMDNVMLTMNFAELAQHLNTTRYQRGNNDRRNQSNRGSNSPAVAGSKNVPRTSYDVDDPQNWQFRPKAMAMGSLVGKQFMQMLGFICDTSADRSPGAREGQSKSYLAFDFQRELLVIKASSDFSATQVPLALRPLDAELAFDDIAAQGIHIIKERKKDNPKVYEVTVTVSCRRPPKFYTPFEDSDRLLGETKRDNFPRKIYRRRATAMDFAISGTSERDAGVIQAIPEGPCAYPTFWNTYRWTLDLAGKDAAMLEGCGNKLRLIAAADPDLDLLAADRPRWNIRKLDVGQYGQLYGVPNLRDVPFATRTLMEGLIAHGIIKPGDIPSLRQALRRHAADDAGANRVLESFYNEERIRDIARLVASRAAYLRKTKPPPVSHLVMIRTVLITPTRILINPPQQEASNSVTRRYFDRLDGVIRVQFADEEDRLFVSQYTKQADMLRRDVGVMARIRRAMQHGICIGGRLFMPVASSASQQKEHAIWFIDSKAIDGLELRRWMGNVDETIVAKHSARMGLPFSTSRIVDLHVQIGKQYPDIERNGHCFTDGVGIAGLEVMREAARALGTTTGINASPSAIQFRLGGAKGVLTCWPQKAREHEIRLRPSQVKFESKLEDLNVVRLAKYQVAFLNRQFIMIMCANGVPQSLMVEIFHDAVADIQGLKERVRNNRITKDDRRLMSLCSDFPLSALIGAGFNENPMLLDIVAIIECRALQDLKWRARVKLPGGVFLIGVADESGTLREGEIFCQYQESDEVEPTIVQSEVLICRAPALHPGDIRRVWAVDRPELRHLKNVIVFSVQGNRPLPNMLGGGDLDGDDYTLIWDERFVRPLKVFEAMDYTAPSPVRVDRVTQEHLNENFVQYMLNDMLGQVDNCHLAMSDIVDFAKTGVAAVLEPHLRPKQWPDFMDKDEVKQIYESNGILGQLFRIVQPDPHFRPCDIQQLDYPVDERITERIHIHGSLIEALKPIKQQYESALQYDMRRYRVCEPEIPSGIAIKNKRRKRARDQNLNEPLRDAYNHHVTEARQAAVAAMEQFHFKSSEFSAMQIIARHAYALTFEKDYVEEWESKLLQEAIEHGAEEGDTMKLRPKPMISFAWVFWQELIQIVNSQLF